MTDEDRGSVLILALGLVTVAILVLLAAVDVAVVHARHRAGQLTADAAARAGAQQVDLSAYYRSGAAAAALPVDSGAARRRVLQYLRQADGGAWRLAELAVDGQAVTVRVEREVTLPVSAPGAPGSVTVAGSGTAQLRRQAVP